VNIILSINEYFEVHGGADRFFIELNKLMVEKGEKVITFTCKPTNAFDNPESARRKGLYAQEYALQRFSRDNYWNELESFHTSLV